MHTLLFGFFVGYFLTASAPIHWTSAHLIALLVALASLLVVLCGAQVVRWRALANSTSLRSSLAIGYFAVGFIVAAGVLGGAVVTAVPPAAGMLDCVGEKVLMRVRVNGLPLRSGDGSRFDARVMDVDPEVGRCQSLRGARLRLGFREAVWISPGQTILAQVRLRRIRGSVSPGAFDHELHAAMRQVLLGGYVAAAISVQDRADPADAFSRLRMSVRRYVDRLRLSRGGVVLALATGDTSLLTKADWALLQNSGTVHLLVISGLHVGLVSVLVLMLARPLAMLLVTGVSALGFGGLRLVPTQAVLASLVTLLYVQLAGAGVPAQRAWVMVSVVFLGLSLERPVSAALLLLLSVALVVALRPLAGFEPGFWLSFALVAWLLFVTASKTRAADRSEDPERSVGKHFAQKFLLAASTAIRLHTGCTLLLLPMLVWLGLPVAPAGPLANFLAVPFVTLLLVPWVLMSTLALGIHPGLAALMFELANWLVEILVVVLRQTVQRWPAAHLPMPDFFELICLVVLVVTTLLPAPARVRGAAVCALLVWVASGLARGDSKNSPVEGHFAMSFLDVGQGLAVVVRTAQSTLLYDTGARFPSGFSYAEAVVVPALEFVGARKLDALVISHSDNDHAGGVEAILSRFPVDRLAGAAVEGANECHWRPASIAREVLEVGEFFGAQRPSRIWRSAGVEFELLQFRDAKDSNNLSCVLVIRGDSATAFLSGDIESAAEAALLSRLPDGVDIMSLPHHGSLTSSSQPLVDRLRPGIAVASSGYANRFGHPHPVVVARFKAAGSVVLNTATEGTIEWLSSDRRHTHSWRLLRGTEWRLGAPLAVSLSVQADGSFVATPE